MNNFLHFDPVNLAVVIAAIIGAWYTLRADSKWHTTWIKKHSEDCEERDKAVQQMLLELTTSNTRLSTLTEGHNQRIGRLETQADQKRQRQ